MTEGHSDRERCYRMTSVTQSESDFLWEKKRLSCDRNSEIVLKI